MSRLGLPCVSAWTGAGGGKGDRGVGGRSMSSPSLNSCGAVSTGQRENEVKTGSKPADFIWAKFYMTFNEQPSGSSHRVFLLLGFFRVSLFRSVKECCMRMVEYSWIPWMSPVIWTAFFVLPLPELKGWWTMHSQISNKGLLFFFLNKFDIKIKFGY